MEHFGRPNSISLGAYTDGKAAEQPNSLLQQATFSCLLSHDCTSHVYFPFSSAFTHTINFKSQLLTIAGIVKASMKSRSRGIISDCLCPREELAFSFAAAPQGKSVISVNAVYSTKGKHAVLRGP